MANEENTEKKEQSRSRQENKLVNWCVYSVLFLLAGLLFLNAQNWQGYQVYSPPENYLTEQYGYEQTESTFVFSGDENSYLQISGQSGLREFFFDFNNVAQEDETITVSYLDVNGALLDTQSQGVWQKGTSFCRVGLIEGEFAAFRVSIPCDFVLSTTYYIYDEEPIEGYTNYYIFWILGAAVLGGVIARLEKGKSMVTRVLLWVTSLPGRFRNSRKGILRLLSVVGGAAVAAAAAMVLLTELGRYTVNHKSYWLLFTVCLLTAIYIGYRREMARRIEVIGFITILLVGSLFSFLEPSTPGVSWDDETHVGSVINLSHLVDRRVSFADNVVIAGYVSVATEKINYSNAEQKDYMAMLDEMERAHYYSYELEENNLSTASIAYIPSVIGITLGKGLGLPYHIAYNMGRWMNVWLLAILSYLSMKQLKSGKIVVLLIALLPTNIFLAGNYTYDVWLTAWSMFGLSVFIGEMQRPEKKMTWKAKWMIVIAMYLAVMPKQVYFPLTFIPFFMPASKFSSKKECWLYRLMVVAACLLPFITVYLQNFTASSMTTGDTRGGEGVDAAGQIAFILQNPAAAGKILLTYLKDYLNPYITSGEYITMMAYLGYVPLNVRVLLVIIIAGALMSHEEKEPARFPWWFRGGVIVVYLLIGIISAVSMYVMFTPVGLETVNGCQGRYLIPALFPLLYFLTRFSAPTYAKRYLRAENIHAVLLWILAAASAYGLWTGCLAFY